MNHNSTSDEQALKASTFISSNSRGRGYRGNRDAGSKDGNMNSRANDDYDKGRGRNFENFNVECYHCHKFSHYSFECRTRLPNEKEEKSNFVENKEGETLLMEVHAKTSPRSKLFDPSKEEYGDRAS
ncbi:hypothetical protein KY289_020810 [Solanum tuberosum]|nr:hypothetical protein KY289_020810 [Solanum tuberosum]